MTPRVCNFMRAQIARIRRIRVDEVPTIIQTHQFLKGHGLLSLST